MAKKILRLKEVSEKVALSPSTIYRLCETSEFPQQIQLGARGCGWYEHELDEWLESRPRGSRPPEDALKGRWAKGGKAA